MCDHLRSAPASPVIPWIQGEARRIGVLISNQRYTALPSPYDYQTRNLFRTHSIILFLEVYLRTEIFFPQ
ncbi:hypothetical protein QUF58_06710 [Anaerolineales bacterium HSG24]|nr:hypothetical protein [Anaerolineales bacterium HSG24]